MESKVKIALCYDFDGTLSSGCMQEYSFIPALGMTAKEFWRKSHEIAKKDNFDSILSYMYLMLEKAKEKSIPVTQDSLKKFGNAVKLFKGVDTWFDRINKYGEENGIEVEHYVISSGNEEMIKGTSIADKFKHVFACRYVYDEDGNAKYPGVSVNYTHKTQHLVRISKGLFNYYENKKVNQHIDSRERYIPYANMIYIGDGETDVPCMKIIKNAGGFAVSVYDERIEQLNVSLKLLREKRVDFIAATNYSEGYQIDNVIKKIINLIRARTDMELLKNSTLSIM